MAAVQIQRDNMGLASPFACNGFNADRFRAARAGREPALEV
jgi:hypothetical protein